MLNSLAVRKGMFVLLAFLFLIRSNADPRFVEIKATEETVILEVQSDQELSDLMLVHRSDLENEEWSPITFSTESSNEYLNTDLSFVLSENGSAVVYVPVVEKSAFYTIDTTPQSDWFSVIETSNGSVTTHELKSGDFQIGISDKGGGYINQLIIPGRGDVMGFHSDRFGRGGQSSIRGRMHGNRYNPTQAGFSDGAGTVCRVNTSLDGSALVVAPRPCCLFRGDNQIDFTEWENLANDNYTESGDLKDVDTIEESMLEGKQATEVTSEFDYYCTYENKLGAIGSEFSGSAVISTPAIRHYFEYCYIRTPGHCILQHKEGPLFDPVAGEITDISVSHPSGVHAATPDELGVITLSMSIRIDRDLWTQAYLGLVNGSTIEDLTFLERPDNSDEQRQFHRNDALGARAPAYNVPNQQGIDVPLFILADSSDPDVDGALGLYYPNTYINKFNAIGVDRASGEVVYEDDRRTHGELRDQASRTADMSWNGFRVHTLGLLNPLRMPSEQYEALRGEFYILYGSPREILENAQRIQPF